MRPHIALIQPIPVLLHFPDEIFICCKLIRISILCGLANFDRPEIIGDQVEEITQSKREAWYILRGDVR
jgi:hypothetical protein